MMKKSFLVYALILSLASANSLSAKEIKSAKKVRSKINLSEIVLDTKNDDMLYQSETFISNGIVTGQASNINTSSGAAVVDKKRINVFVHLNPIRPIEKTQNAIEKGATYIDNNVDKGLEKLENTQLHIIKDTDNLIDNGVVKTDTVIGKFFGYLDKGTNSGLEKMDDVVNLATNKTAVQEWIDGDHAARKYFGARPILESHGLTVDSSLIYSPYMKTGGGANGEMGEKGFSLFSVGVSLDTEAANMWKGGKFFMLYQRKAGMGLSGSDGAMGDYFGFDGWNMPEVNQISEYWYQQKLFDGKVRMKFGKQDSNSDFGFLNSGWDFMNTAFSVNPTVPQPSYPYTPLGFMLEINPKEWLSVRDGIYYTSGGCPFNMTEIEFKPMIKKMPGRYMLGAWETGNPDGFSTTAGVDGSGLVYNNFNRNFGAYFNFEQMVYKEQKDNADDMQGLVLFGQTGISPSDKNDLSKYASVGLHYKGPIPKRDNDLVGVAVGCGNFASRLNNISYADGGRIGSETVVEAFYRVFITKWFYLQPDVQFIMNPGGQYASSVAIGLRSVITF